MRPIYFPKLIVLLLLATFLTTSVGNVFAYDWCLGEDGHVEVKYATGDGCCDKDLNVAEALGRNSSPAFTAANAEHCGSCLDFSAQKNEAVFAKRLKRVSSASFSVLEPKVFAIKAVDNVKQVVSSLALQLQPRISQALLAHRTIVLLN